MPAVIPFIPLIAAGIGVGGTLISGAQADARNNQQIGLAQESQKKQQEMIQQLMSGISPQAYQEQARQATMLGQQQIGSDFAQRGMLDSGAMYTASANAAGKNYADAQARYQQDRVNAIGAAMGAQGNMTRGYGDFVNPNPYSGLSSSVGALGSAAGQYMYNNPASPATSPYTPAPAISTSPYGPFQPAPPIPGYGPTYASSGILGNWGRSS